MLKCVIFVSLCLTSISLPLISTAAYPYQSVIDKFNLSDPRCTMIFTDDAYMGYQTFYPLTKWKLKDGTVRMDFSVIGPSDAHLQLSATPSRKSNEKETTFEIVIGAGGNAYSSVRRNNPKLTPSKVLTSGVMSTNYPRNFWIKLSSSYKFSFFNLLEVGGEKEGVILSHLDYYLTQMEYVAFGSWTGVKLLWLLGDCKKSQNSTEENPIQMTNLEKLSQHLLTTYDPYTIPVDNSTLIVDMKVDILHIVLDAKSSILSTHAQVNMEWFDPKMQWDPENYDGLNHLKFYMRKIWMPDIIIINKVFGDATKNTFDFAVTRVFFNGTVMWSPKILFETRCNMDVSNWPWDVQTCEINLGLYQPPDEVYLALNETPNMFLHIHNQEWKIDKIIKESKFVNNKSELSPDNNALTIKFNLVRQRTSFIYIFVLPTIVLVALIPSMFCLPPLSSTKTYLNLCSIIILLIFLLTEESMLPALTSSTPKIIQLTGKLVFFLCIQTALVSFIKHLSTVTTLPPSWVLNLLKNRCVSLFLPINNPSEGEDGNKAVNSHWTMLAMCLDRILHVAIIIIIIPIELALTLPF